MKGSADVVVIGGGIVGCAVLYHLTKFGMTDSVLLERKQLTAGSTWHAAAGFHTMNGNAGVARLQAYTIDLYPEIQEISGQDVGLHKPGGVTVAATNARWEFLKAEHSRHKVMGIDSRLVTPEEIASLTPLIDTRDLIGGLYDQTEGHLDPYGATHAFAKAARMNGAAIHTQTKVEELSQRPDGSWDVVTDQGTIHATHVINAAGLWAREVGAMVGVHLPLVPMEHHYLVTEEIPALAALDRESPVLVDLDGEIYLRQEHNGVLLGVYEQNPYIWAKSGTPWDYGETDLLPPRMDHLEEALVSGFGRLPLVAEAGIKRIVNGPFTFTPDGNPLVGPVPGKKNYWVACGVMAGFSQGAGIGLALAQWMSKGLPDGDVFGIDVARFGNFATADYTHRKATEFYERRFRIPYPNESWPAGRPLKTSPVHDRHVADHAVFGAYWGLEAPDWFAPTAADAHEEPTFHRSRAHEFVEQECHAVRTAAGILDITSFARYEVTGPDAEAWIARMSAGRIPPVGKVRLAPLLAEDGRLMGDLTVMRTGEEAFWLFGSGYLQEWHMRWFNSHLPATGVRIVNRSDDMTGFMIAGPNARQIVAKVVGADVSAQVFPMMSAAQTEAGMAPVLLARLSLTGELSYEIHTRAIYGRTLYDRLIEAGAEHGLRPFGVRALLSLRLEKGVGIWSAEFSPDYTPAMCGLDRFVDYDRSGFIGREAALKDRGATPARRLVMLEIDSEAADAMGNEPVFAGDRLVGFVTSGGYGHTVARSLAMGYVDTEVSDGAQDLSVEILGQSCPARILDRPPVDPDGTRMRA